MWISLWILLIFLCACFGLILDIIASPELNEEDVPIKEFDIVQNIIEIGSLPINTTGTVVHKYNDEMFEVEFFPQPGTSLVETVSRRDLKIKNYERMQEIQDL